MRLSSSRRSRWTKTSSWGRTPKEDFEIPFEILTVHGKGTHDTSEDSVWFDITEVDIQLDGEDFVEALTRFVREYPAFEQAILNGLSPAELKEQMAAGFIESISGPYTLDGDRLLITMMGETLEFQRVAPASAVARMSWGALKRIQHRE